MFTLPTVAIAPIANGFGAVVIPTIDGALYGWLLVAVLIVTAFGILRATSRPDSGRINEPSQPAAREPLVSAELPRKIAA